MRKIISAAALWLTAVSFAAGQNQVITPRFVPANPVTSPSGVVQASAIGEKAGAPKQEKAPAPKQELTPAAAQQPLPFLPQARQPGMSDEATELYVRSEPPGPQRLFQRDSESKFFGRIAQDKRKQQGGTPAIFPEEPVISRERHMPRLLGAQLVEVEPCYLTHGRLYFEQPNFERAGYSFGVLTPGINAGVFMYDFLLWPYHIGTDWRRGYECSAGNSLKCLPGDPSPFVWPCERFSVTGLVGQTGAILGGMYLFP